MSINEIELLDSWMADETFIAWAKGATSAETKHWDTFFRENGHLNEIKEMAKFSILNLDNAMPGVPSAQSKDALRNIKEKIAARENTQKNTSEKTAKTKWIWILLGLLLLSALSWITQRYISGTDITVTSADKRTEINLTDGTRVILNKETKISYNTKDHRNIELEGEAYFYVAKSTTDKKIFNVKTEDLLITVLGTEFNVNTEDEKTSVFLNEGNVQIEVDNGQQNKLQLQPGDLFTYSKKLDKVITNEQADVQLNTVWKEDVIFFEEAPLSEVLNIMSEAYDLDIDYQNVDIGDKRFTGGLPVQELSIATETIKQVFEIKITKNKNNYIISK